MKTHLRWNRLKKYISFKKDWIFCRQATLVMEISSGISVCRPNQGTPPPLGLYLPPNPSLPLNTSWLIPTPPIPLSPHPIPIPIPTPASEYSMIRPPSRFRFLPQPNLSFPWLFSNEPKGNRVWGLGRSGVHFRYWKSCKCHKLCAYILIDISIR